MPSRGKLKEMFGLAVASLPLLAVTGTDPEVSPEASLSREREAVFANARLVSGIGVP
jgi:hypothetical protein